MLTQTRSKRKSTGGRYRSVDPKRKRNLGRYPIMTQLKDKKVKSVRVLGGNIKTKLKSINYINVALKDGSIKKTNITNVLDNPANKHLARRNILTKGAIIETPMGKVRVTSRPGQDGNMNGVLV